MSAHTKPDFIKTADGALAGSRPGSQPATIGATRAADIDDNEVVDEPCADCGRTDMPLHTDYRCPNCHDAVAAQPAPAPQSAQQSDWAVMKAVAAKIEAGEPLDDDDYEVMKQAILSAAGRVAPRWTPAQLGITDPDVSLSVHPGSADGDILCCDSCACLFRPYDDGDGIYVDRYVTAKQPSYESEPDKLDAGESTRGECSADETCPCHQAPHFIPKN